MQPENIELYLTVLDEGLAQVKHDLKSFKYSVCPFWHVKMMNTSQTLQVLFSLFWMSALGGRTARRSTVGASFSWEWLQMRAWFGQINLLQTSQKGEFYENMPLTIGWRETYQEIQSFHYIDKRTCSCLVAGSSSSSTSFFGSCSLCTPYTCNKL